MKNCAFQYATDREILINSDLITIDEARKLWDDNVNDFISRMEKDQQPEMAIWIGMNSDTNYHTKERHWQADDLILKDGNLYEMVIVHNG